MLRTALAVCGLAVTVPSCSSSPPAAPLVRGTYEAESGGPFIWVDFEDASHYSLLRSAGCSIAAGAPTPCQSAGTYAIKPGGDTVAFTDAHTQRTATYAFDVLKLEGSPSTKSLRLSQAVRPLGGSLGADDSGAVSLAVDAGSLDLTSGMLATALTVGGATITLVNDQPEPPIAGASGYLVAGPSRGSIGPNVLCGATLLAPNVILTVAHCADKMPAGSVWAFGLGEVGGDLYYVRDDKFFDHPAYEDASTGTLASKLRENDLAYLVLETAVSASAMAATAGPSLRRDCPSGGETAIVYRPARQVDTACVELSLTLPGSSPDPIYEVHPTGDGLCPAAGDEGSALYRGDGFIGIFAGSITAALMECTSYLNGYESIVGHQSFIDTAVAAGTGAGS